MECSSSGCSPAPDDSCRGCAGSLGALSSFKQVAGRLRCSFRSNGKTLTYAYDRQQIPAVSRHPFSRWLGQDLPWRRLSTQHHPSPAGRRFCHRVDQLHRALGTFVGVPPSLFLPPVYGVASLNELIKKCLNGAWDLAFTWPRRCTCGHLLPNAVTSASRLGRLGSLEGLAKSGVSATPAR